MKIRILFFLSVLLGVIIFPASSVNQSSERNDQSFDDCITIDGRTYKVSPAFSMPAGIDKDSPVKLLFSNESHELLSIERMTDDNTNSDQLEYHFGIVNAISKSNTDLEYRVYVDGTGYLFTKETRIDERTAFLDKYASIAIFTKNGKVIICRVLASNTAVPDKDIILGKVEQVIQEEDKYILEINGTDHVLDSQTETVGTVMIPGTWVFGYEINDTVRFISVITDDFPDPAEVIPFSGFVNLVGDKSVNGTFYLTVGNTTLRILPDTAITGNISEGNYVSGFRLEKDVLLISQMPVLFDKSRYEIFYQPITDFVSIRDINSKSGQTIVSLYLGENEIELDSYTSVIGEIKKGSPVMAVVCDGKAKIIVVRDIVESERKPVIGYISSVSGTAPSYEITVGGKSYFTTGSTVIAAESSLEPGTQIAGIASGNGMFDLLTCYGNCLPDPGAYLYSGVISKIAVNAFQIDDRIIDYDSDTSVSGSFSEGKYAFVSLHGDYADSLYILPDEYSDLDYRTFSGILSGIGSPDVNGRRTVRLNEDVFYLDSDTKIQKNLAYDEIGTALYRGQNQVSILDVLPKPDDKGEKIYGTISYVHSDSSNGEIILPVGNSEFIIPAIAAFSGFYDSSRLRPGAVVEGYAYGNEILAVRIIKGAGLFGLLNPPWLEYMLAGGISSIILLWFVVKAVRNKSTWHTGSPETGAGNTIILHESDGQIHRYTADGSLFTYIMDMHERTISVKVRRGKIVAVR